MVGTISGAHPRSGLFERILPEAFALFRERLAIYGLMALACALAAAESYGRVNLLETFATGNALTVFRTAPMNVVLLTALIAIFFVLPSALRRIEPKFKMTLWRALITFLMVACIGAATDLGYAAAFVPGVILGVLMSQALIAALLGAGDKASVSNIGSTIANALVGSFHMTRERFGTTFAVCTLSLGILGVPFFVGLVAMLVFDALSPRSLIVTAPALFLTFVYCECVRYVLIVRWYGRLAKSAQSSERDFRAAA